MKKVNKRLLKKATERLLKTAAEILVISAALLLFGEAGFTARAAEQIRVVLRNQQVQVLCGEQELYASDPDWTVQDTLLADFDRDGKKELALLVLKKGSFGKYRPFWVEEDSDELSQHIFIYRFTERDGRQDVRPAWMSSALTMSVKSWNFDHDRYTLVITEPDGTQSAWRWEYFGLKEAPLPETDTDNGARLTVLAAGDVIAHSQILQIGKTQGGNYDFLFRELTDIVSSADLAIVNQETPLVLNGNISGRPPFGSPPELADAYVHAGIDVVTCATNHMLDRGLQGVLDTAEVLDSAGLQYAGIHGLQKAEDRKLSDFVLKDAAGFQIAVLNYTQMTNGRPLPEEAPRCVETLLDEKAVRAQLRSAREAAELVIVCVHWGTEYSADEDDFQKRWAGVFLEEGVDLVIGTHPHVLQPAALYMDMDGHVMPVFYSLGNLVSAQDEPERILGGLAGVSWERCGSGENCESGEIRLAGYELLPVVTHQEGGDYSARLLEDYTEELASRHRLGITKKQLEELWENSQTRRTNPGN